MGNECVLILPGKFRSILVGFALKPNPFLKQYFNADPQSSVSEHVPSPKLRFPINLLKYLAWHD